MMFHKRFFKRSKKYLPHIFGLKGDIKTQTEQVLKLPDDFKVSIDESNRSSSLKELRFASGESAKKSNNLPACALKRAKQFSRETVGNNSLSSPQLAKFSNRGRISSHTILPQSQHPAFRGSIFTGMHKRQNRTKANANKTQRLGFLNIKNISNLQSIPECDEEIQMIEESS